ncbi:DeoR/GlpR family DNA-binding transcription regulator [Paramicrobacterium agarici]|uniref:DeoR/GlpR family DNA-binding transcription regulator n=1 Tax=Paramicrobacterium agarici TaxID=630514 RepID=UPI000BFAA9AF|nr:DeoR/GlpR family DNA-binding transcription regulator [Microbacterium agarici]
MKQIVSTVLVKNSMEVHELARHFDVSEATIRRDLELLEQQQLLSRTHGGATRHIAFNDVPLGYKTCEDSEEKKRIARAALAYANDARVVGFTGGTTIGEFAPLLSNRDGLTVVTNALNIAIRLTENPRMRVFTVGGEVRSSSQEAVGPSAETFLLDYHIDVSFIGVDGVDGSTGCTNYDQVGAKVNSTMMKQSRKTVVLADATKIGRIALASLCPMNAVSVLITDTRAPDSAVESIEAHGCTVIRA